MSLVFILLNLKLTFSTFAMASSPTLKISSPLERITLLPGGSFHEAFSIEVGGSFNGPVSLSVTGLPVGVTAAWSVNPATLSSATGTSTLTLTAAASVTQGNSPITVTATGDGISASQSVDLNIPSGIVLSASSATMQSAGSTAIYFSATPQDGANGPGGASGAVLTLLSGLPAGVTYTVGAPQISASGQTVWRIGLTGSPAALGGTSTLNLLAQITDAVSGTVYSASLNAALDVTLSLPTLKINSPSERISLLPGGTFHEVFSLQGGGSFNGPVSLSVTGLPTGVTAAWSTNPAMLSSATGTSILTLTSTTSVAVGNSPIAVTATGDGISASQNLSLNIPSGIVLSASSATMQSAGSTVIKVTATPQDGASGPADASGAVLTLLSGLPAGVTYTVGAPQISASGQTVWRIGLTGSPATLAGAETLNLLAQVTDGVSGAIYSASLSVRLNVTLSPPTLKLTSASAQITLLPGGTFHEAFRIEVGGSFSSPVSLSVAGLPVGVTAAWSSNPATLSSATGTSVLTLISATSVDVGNSSITVTAIGDGISASQNLSLHIPSGIVLSASSATMQSAGSTAIYVSATPQDGANGPASASGAVLTLLSGLPAGVTYTVGAPQISASGQTVWRIGLTGSPAAVADAATLNLLAQVTDSVSGAIYSASLSVGLNVTLSPPTLKLTSASTQMTLLPGGTFHEKFSIEVGGSFSGPVSLSVTGLPTGVTAIWSSNPATLTPKTGITSLTLTATPSVALGHSPITVTATGHGVSASQNVELNIPSGIFVAVSPATMQSAGSTAVYVTATPQFGANGPAGTSGAVLALLSGLPSGVVYTVDAPQISSNGKTVWRLSLTGSSEAVAGTSILNLLAQITDGTSGTVYSASPNVALNVTLSPPTLKLTSASTQITLLPGGIFQEAFSIDQGGSFNAPVSLSVTGLPAGVTAAWSSNPTILSSSTGTSTLNLTAASATAQGKSPITVTATGDGISASQNLSLNIPSGILVSASPARMQSAGSTVIDVTATPQDGANGPVAASGAVLTLLSGLPTGVTDTVSAPHISPNGETVWRVRFTGSPAAIAGTSVVNLLAQVTDGISGTVYSAYPNAALNVMLSPPTLMITSAPSQITLLPGGTVYEAFSIEEGGSFDAPVSLSVIGLPAGVTAAWSSNPAMLSSATGTSILTLTSTSSVAQGNSPIIVTATGDGIAASENLNLNVPSGILVSAPSPAMLSAGSTVVYVTATPQDGANGPAGASGAVLTVVSGLPTGVTCSVSAPQVSANGQTVWRLSLTGSPAAVASATTLNLLAQVTDSVSGTVYSASLNAAMTVTLSPPTLMITSASTQVTLLPGGTFHEAFNIEEGGSFNGPISLSVTGLPTGVTAIWSSNPATLSSGTITGTSTLTLTATTSVALGVAPITVTATGDGISASQTLNLNIPSGISVTASPATMQSTGSTAVYVTATPQFGANGPAGTSGAVLTLLSGLPAGVTCIVGGPQVSANGQTTWRLNLTGSPVAVVGVSTLNLLAQVTDSVSATVYSASLSVALNMVLSPPTLLMTPASTQVTLPQGTTVSDSFTFAEGNAFSGPVGLSVSGLPAGVTATWSSNPATLSSATITGTSTLTLTATTAVALGIAPITVTATGDGISASQNVNLVVSAAQITFSFTIGAQGSHTSAAVYNSSGTLVRTLWSNSALSPGTYNGGWDGNTDLGSPVQDPGPYTVKLLTNNVNYNWDGVIGTTSDDWFAQTRLESFSRNGQWRLAFVGNTGWFSTGYAEGNQFNFGYFNDTDPNRPMMVNPSNPLLPTGAITSPYFNQNLTLVDVATDGQWLYFAQSPSWFGTLSFVTAFDVTAPDPNSTIPAVFGSGTSTSGPSCIEFPLPVCPTNDGTTAWENTTLSYIDPEPAGLQPPTGIAVQHNGNILAVSHGNYTTNGATVQSNEIRLFDKRLGISLGVITSIPNPSQMAFNSQGLWVISNGSLYLVGSPGTGNTVTQPITQLSNPVSVATNSVTDHIFVLDGGSSQQMKEFTNTLQLVGSYGVSGGYNDCNPTIRNDHLLIDQTPITGQGVSNGSWVRVEESTGDVWIQEGGNRSRILHLTPASSISGSNAYSYVNQIQFQVPNYTAITSETMPTRVFAGLYEYTVSYDPEVPLQAGDPDPNLGGNGAWSLTRNWGVCADGAAGSLETGVSNDSTSGGIRAAEQLSNGNAYAEVSSGATLYVYQLSSSGQTQMTRTQTSFPTWQWKQLFRDGSLGYTGQSNSSPTATETVFNAKLEAFDAQGNPHWGSFAPVAQIQLNLASQPTLHGDWNTPFSGVEPTTGGYYPIYKPIPFNLSTTTRYPHLAGILPGNQTFAWTTMPEVCLSSPDGQGSFPCSESFGGHNGIGPEHTEGQNIFVMYDGQYASWGDQIYHYWEDGLMIGQFGNQAPYVFRPVGKYPPGQAGNIGAFSTVSYNGDIYVYHSDEAIHPPIHRWHISNLQSIHEFAGTASLGSASSIQMNQLF